MMNNELLFLVIIYNSRLSEPWSHSTNSDMTSHLHDPPCSILHLWDHIYSVGRHFSWIYWGGRCYKNYYKLCNMWMSNVFKILCVLPISKCIWNIFDIGEWCPLLAMTSILEMVLCKLLMCLFYFVKYVDFTYFHILRPEFCNHTVPGWSCQGQNLLCWAVLTQTK